MDIQDILDAKAEQRRNETLKDSNQLTLGELTLHIKHVEDQNKPVVFDDGAKCPVSLGSWRGSYTELAIRYEDCMQLEEAITVAEFLAELQQADGAEYRGYKGGDYKMSNSTPVWVANRGSSSGFKYSNQGVVDVTEEDDRVVINTADVPF